MESNYVGNKNFGVERYNFRTNINTEVGRFKLNAILAYTRNNSISTTGSSLKLMQNVFRLTIIIK